MNPIIPTVFAHNKKEFEDRFDKLRKISKQIQIDFMDGSFVRAKGIGLQVVPNLKNYKNNFEAHLMVCNPLHWIWGVNKLGFKKVIFHFEALKKEEKIRNFIIKAKKEKLEVFIAINPETPVEKIFPFLKDVDGVLFLGVHPGKEHQEFIPKIYEKIRNLKKISKGTNIQVDGGVNLLTAGKLAKLGVDYVNSGSFVADAENPRENLNKLEHLFNKKGVK